MAGHTSFKKEQRAFNAKDTIASQIRTNLLGKVKARLSLILGALFVGFASPQKCTIPSPPSITFGSPFPHTNQIQSKEREGAERERERERES